MKNIRGSVARSARWPVLFTVLFVSSVMCTEVLADQHLVSASRASFASGKFAGAYQVAAAHYARGPKWMGADFFEVAGGVMGYNEVDRPWFSVGPVWRWKVQRTPLVVDIGFSPTFFGGSTFGDRDLGGNFHFTSSFAVGRTFKSFGDAALTLRLQHISNGGIHERNPGMDMIGLSFSRGFLHD